MIDALMEELFYLDEIAGELSPEDNARIEQRRAEIKAEIKALRSLGTAQVDQVLSKNNDNWYDEQYELDTDYL